MTSCICISASRVGSALSVEASRVGSALSVEASRVGSALSVEASRVGSALSVEASRIGHPLQINCSIVCEVSNDFFLNVTPDVVWITFDDSGEFAIESNVKWIIL